MGGGELSTDSFSPVCGFALSIVKCMPSVNAYTRTANLTSSKVQKNNSGLKTPHCLSLSVVENLLDSLLPPQETFPPCGRGRSSPLPDRFQLTSQMKYHLTRPIIPTHPYLSHITLSYLFPVINGKRWLGILGRPLMRMFEYCKD